MRDGCSGLSSELCGINVASNPVFPLNFQWCFSLCLDSLDAGLPSQCVGNMQLSSVVIKMVIGAHCRLFMDSSEFGHSLWVFYWLLDLVGFKGSIGMLQGCVVAVCVGG